MQWSTRLLPWFSTTQVYVGHGVIGCAENCCTGQGFSFSRLNFNFEKIKDIKVLLTGVSDVFFLCKVRKLCGELESDEKRQEGSFCFRFVFQTWEIIQNMFLVTSPGDL